MPTTWFMSDTTIPTLLLEQFITELEQAATATEKWLATDASFVLRKVSRELRGLLSNPIHQWVSVADAARLLQRSEETIRRWCRTGATDFTFRNDAQGRYWIWLPDLTPREEFPDAQSDAAE